MELRDKIRLGFVVVGSVLLMASLVSILEMGRMRRSVNMVISNNVANINASTQLLEVTDQHLFGVLSQIGIPRDSALSVISIYDDPRFATFMEATGTTFYDKQEKALSDTILYAYAAYMQVVNEAPDLWAQYDYTPRRDWYAERLDPVYNKLRGYLQKLVSFEQAQLHKNTEDIQDGFYRSMMPGVIAVASGMILLFLLSYFIGMYLIDPIRKINAGLKSVLLYKQKYTVRIDSDDELQTLNDSVSQIADSYTSSSL